MTKITSKAKSKKETERKTARDDEIRALARRFDELTYFVRSLIGMSTMVDSYAGRVLHSYRVEAVTLNSEQVLALATGVQTLHRWTLHMANLYYSDGTDLRDFPGPGESA